MNGRAYPGALAPAPAAVERSSTGPVLTWNVEPTQFPAGTYPEMPTAAAAAVSPVVPTAATAAAPPDPYGRCWQSQVDPGACFPYFGTLYGSSLPPPSYRMQPGCMSNMGQFWPPTPPPEGCVRYDGTNNLHYCSPLTPVFRHGGESLPQNVLGMHQRLSHYSHLIDMNKDSGLKRVDSCSDSSRHRQKAALMSAASKHGKESQQQQQAHHHQQQAHHHQQQRLCHCYECNEKCASRTTTTTHSVNKENISSQSKFLEQRYSEEKLKSSASRNCKKVKSDCYSIGRNSAQPNGSAINGYNCSIDQNVKSSTLVQLPDFIGSSSQKAESAQVTSAGYPQYDFIRPDSRPMHNNRCSSNSLLAAESSTDVPVTLPELKSSDQLSRFENSTERSQHKMHVSSSCYTSCVCPSVQTSSSSSKSQQQHSSENSCCFSPPCMSSRTLYQNYPENSGHSKTPNTFVVYGNGYNASPLKNVYFSYYESENFDQASTSERKHSRDNLGKQERINNNCSDSRLTSVTSDDTRDYMVSGIGSGRTSCSFGVGSTSGRNQYGNSTVPNTSHSYQYSVSAEPQKTSNISRYSGNQCSKRSDISSYYERLTKVGAAHIKQEKVDSPDCKYQRSHASGGSSSRCQPSPVSVATSGVLNLSTSVRCPKIEPQDDIANVTSMSEQFISAASPLQSSPPSSYAHSNASIKKDIAPKTAQAACPEELKYSETEHRFILNASAASSPAKCQVPGASSSLQMQGMENDCAPAVPEDIVSVMQVEPLSGAESAVLNEMPAAGSEAPVNVSHEIHCHQEPIESETMAAENIMEDMNREPPDLSESMVDDDISDEPPSLCEQIYDDHDNDEIGGSDAQSDSMDDLPPKLEQHCDPPSTSNQNKPAIISLRNQIKDSSAEVIEKCKDEMKPPENCKQEDLSSESNKLSCKDDSSVHKKTSDEEIIKVLPCDVKEPEEEEEKESTICTSESQSAPVEECHGLYLLLEGIEHRSNTNTNSCTSPTRDSSAEQDTETGVSDSKFSVSSAMEENHSGKKLNALCAFVEQQFAAEFGNHLRISSPVVCEQHESQSLIISNYPIVKTEDTAETLSSAPVQSCDGSSSFSKLSALQNSLDETPEQEMRKKLAELQQKYKEKQKELARLRPKKTKTSSSLDSRLSDASSASNNSSCHSLFCSKEESMSSTAEFSPEKQGPQSELISPRLGNQSSAGSSGAISNAKMSSKKEAVKHLTMKFSAEQLPQEKRSRSQACSKSPKLSRSRSVTKRKSKLRSDKRSNKVTCCRTSRRSSNGVCVNGDVKSNQEEEECLDVSRKLFSDMVKSRLSTDASSEQQTSDDSKLMHSSTTKHNSGKRKLQKSKESKLSHERSSERNSHSKNKQKVHGEKCDMNICSASSMVGKTPKKRKSENPQRYMPSKQVRLTETIITKQLRNRILFESPGFGSSGNNEKQYDFPEELSDALRKCHLSERSDSSSRKSSDNQQTLATVGENKEITCYSEGTCLRMSLENLVENKRILAMEDGLFYAGCIREIQSPDMYAISLDGQRGNKRHMFSKEEMLSQTILEVKPTSLDELPEGTRVCAFWSHQYRCLYPGTVMKAPTPSADWSEPRVFVEFDDGDSAQIAMKNIRFLPSDIILFAEEEKGNQSEMTSSFMVSREELSEESKKISNRKRRRASTRGLRKHSRTSKNEKDEDLGTNAPEECSSIVKMEVTQTVEEDVADLGMDDEEGLLNCEESSSSIIKKTLKKTMRHQTKRKQDSKGKSKDGGSSSEKKKHKKYKGHKHHHHHRHHHHRRKHCHHHRHCKKHRHHKRASNIDNIINVVIPSTGIPLGNLITKSTRNSVKEAETQCIGHSRNDKLPQIMTQSAADQNGLIQCKKDSSR